jgi:hypothetical protein
MFRFTIRDVLWLNVVGKNQTAGEHLLKVRVSNP